MTKKYTKREFLKVLATTPAAAQILDDDEEDDEESWWDKYFGDDEEEEDAVGTIYVDELGVQETINPGSNELFIAEDTGAIFRPTDEGNWRKFATLGESPWTKTESGALTPKEGGSLEIEQARITSEVVRAFGPENGLLSDYKLSDYTDIGAAVLAAADDMPTDGGSIELPAGRFQQTTPIDVTNMSRNQGLARVAIRGQGANVTVLEPADNADIRQIDYQPINTPDASAPQFFFTLAGITFDGNRANGNTKTSVFLGDVRDVRIDDVFMFDAGGKCFRTASSWGYKVTNSIFERAVSHGYELTGAGSGQNGYFAGCRFGSNDANGLNLSGAADNMLFGCEFDGNGGHGIKCLNDTATRLVGCSAASNSVAGYQADGSSKLALVGCQANSNGTDDIDIQSDASDTVIDAPTFRNATITDAGVRTRFRGVIETTATPAAADYSQVDAGVVIIDKSSTADPYDRYTVLQDGTLDGPY